ncbi:MAG: hypothetical protein A2085_02760 [Gemmatimonadetes bacterium GWC2_71_10]|nr:MAG: hypothetical protein A2085_02760 [Gemmatimonadetes bacterium GWC2_71_10]
MASGAWTLSLAQCPDGTPPPCGARAARTAAATNSVAVLYFESLSADTADSYIAQGLTEEVTSRLGDVERLRVIGRSAVRHAQRTTSAVRDLGRLLRVRYVVEGSARRAGDRVRVSVRLLRAADGVRVWGATYDRTMTDLLTVQEDIAREVTTNVVGQLLPAERAALSARPTEDAEAYDHFVRGNVHVGRRSSAGFERAAAAYDLAIRRDPRFVAAHARRAYALTLAYAYGAGWAPRDSLLAWARRSAATALRLDSASSDAWIARCVTATWADHDLWGATRACERAVLLNPRNAEAWHVLGVTRIWIGADSAALHAFRQAQALDPGRAVTVLDIGEVMFVTRRFDAALALFDSAIAIDPDQARPHADRAMARLRLGALTLARQDAAAAAGRATPGLQPVVLSMQALIDAALGDSALARARLSMMDSLHADPIDRARALVAQGLTDSALTVLEAGPYAATDWYALRWPEFDPIRASPGFQRVFERLRPLPRRP